MGWGHSNFFFNAAGNDKKMYFSLCLYLIFCRHPTVFFPLPESVYGDTKNVVWSCNLLLVSTSAMMLSSWICKKISTPGAFLFIWESQCNFRIILFLACFSRFSFLYRSQIYSALFRDFFLLEIRELRLIAGGTKCDWNSPIAWCFFSGDVRGIPYIKTFCLIYFYSKDPPPVFRQVYTYFTRIIKFSFLFFLLGYALFVCGFCGHGGFFFQCENTGNFAVTNKKEIFRDRKSHVSFVYCSGGNTLPGFVEVDPQKTHFVSIPNS